MIGLQKYVPWLSVEKYYGGWSAIVLNTGDVAVSERQHRKMSSSPADLCAGANE
jgi:hypothetical protein